MLFRSGDTDPFYFDDITNKRKKVGLGCATIVIQLMKQGLLSKEIANSLNVSINTINTHRQNILLKLKANNSIEAVNIAQRLGLLNSSIQ